MAFHLRGFTPRPKEGQHSPEAVTLLKQHDLVENTRGFGTAAECTSLRNLPLVWGFTVIETLIVILITAMFSGFFIAYNSTSRQQIALTIEQAKVAQVAARAKSLALAGYGRGASSTCGFGLRVDYPAQSYAIFNYTISNCDALNSVDPADSSKYRETVRFALGRGLVFRRGAGVGPAQLDYVFFVPPDPRTLIWVGGGAATSTAGTIYLGTADGAASAKVSVGAGGQISF